MHLLPSRLLFKAFPLETENLSPLGLHIFKHHGQALCFPRRHGFGLLGLKLSTKNMVVYQGMSYAYGSLLTLIHRERIGRRKRRMQERERERKKDGEGEKEGRKSTLV